MPRQTNFGGGEIAPMSWGRSDRSFFARGLRTMRNFFPTKQHGAAVSRPGSLYITTTKDGSSQVRLIPFVYSDDSSYCLEVGISGAARQLYFRFFTSGRQVQGYYATLSAVAGAFAVGEIITGGTSGAWAEVVSVKNDAGVIKLQLARVTGVFQAAETITAPSGATATYDSAANEVLELQAGTVAAGFDITQVKFAQLGAVMILTHPSFPAQELRQYPNVGTQVKFTIGNRSLSPPRPYFSTATVGGSYPVITATAAPGASTPAREWVYLVTLTVQDAVTGQIYETLPWRITEDWDGNLANAPATYSPDMLAVYLEAPVTIERGLHIDGPSGGDNVPTSAYRVIAANYYRGRGPIPGGVYGFIGSTDWYKFIDVGAEPDFFTPPPFGTHPFRITTPAGATVYENPTAVAFFQNRLVFGGTPRRPATIFTSETDAFDRWDLNTIIHTAGEALVFELASRRFEQIVSMVAHQRLIIGTKSSVWSLSGAQGGVLDFDSVDARVIDEVGMTELPPLIVEGDVLFARTKGAGVRALRFDGREGTYGGVDISGQSDHLFVGSAVGALGAASSKAIVDWTYAEDPWGLIWAVRADGTLLSLTIGAEGAVGWARHDGSPTSLSGTYGYGTPAAYKRVCAVPEGEEDAVYVIVERAIAGSAGTMCIERMTSRVRRGLPEDDGCVDCGVMVEQGVPALAITGLDHLEGEQVYMCAKGNAPQGPFTVQGGAIALSTLPVANDGAGVTLYVGLLYTPDLELLDVVSADSRLKQKTVTRVGFELDQSAGILAGQDFEHLVESRPHTVESGWDAPVPGTQVLQVVPSRRWDTGGRACLRQSLPLPVTVVGAVRELDVGG